MKEANNVCRNFNYNEKVDGTLELISLNCDKCEFDGNCDIKTAYHNAKDYSASLEFAFNRRKRENNDNNKISRTY